MTRQRSRRCRKCGMSGRSVADFVNDRNCCVKCEMLVTLETKLSNLEARLHNLEAKMGENAPIPSPALSRTYAEALATPTPSSRPNPPPKPDQNKGVPSQLISMSTAPSSPTSTQNQDKNTPSISMNNAPSSPTPTQVDVQGDGFKVVQRKKGSKKKTKTNDVVIGTSIVRDVTIINGKYVTPVTCLPGARMGDIIAQLKLLKQAGKKFRRIVIHAGGNDARRRQSEVLKMQVVAACEFAKSMSDRVIFSGPLPNMSTDEMFSRHLSFNHWLSSFTKNNEIDFINNWSSFWGKPELIGKDCIHPTVSGTAVLTQNIEDSLNHPN